MLSILSFASCGASVSTNNVINSSNAFVPYPPFASRTSGVAPLGVFFDAAEITAPGVTKPFHHLQYTWDFGDVANNSQWTNGSNGSILAAKTCDSTHNSPGCRNYATGGVAAHVYETACNPCTATLTVTDGIGYSASYTFPITIYDPTDPTHGLGTSYCVYTTTLFGSCPGGGTEHLTTGTFQGDIAAAIAANSKYILFKRGDYSETMTATATISAAGPGLIGSYGSTGSSLPAVSVQVGTAPGYSKGLNITSPDWRVEDMAFTGGPTNTRQTGVTLSTNSVALRVTTGNFLQNFNGINLLFIQDANIGPSTADNSAGTGDSYGMICSCTNGAWMGNTITLGNPSGGYSHELRLEPANKYVISNSTFNGDTAVGNLSLHGGQSPTTQYVMVEDNVLTAINASANPQNSASYEVVQDAVFERNYFKSAGLSINATNITVRNNVFDITNALLNNGRAVIISYEGNTAGLPMPSGLEIYNNSIYEQLTGGGGFTGIIFWIDLTSTCNAIVTNNIAYYNSTASFNISNAGACIVTGASGTHGNSTDAQTTSISPYVWSGSNTITKPSDFTLGASSYAKTPGTSNGNETGGQSSTTVPLWTDFFGAARQTIPTPYDAGAIKY